MLTQSKDSFMKQMQEAGEMNYTQGFIRIVVHIWNWKHVLMNAFWAHDAKCQKICHAKIFSCMHNINRAYFG